MRKLFLIGILMVLIISISSTEVLAKSHSNSSSKNYLTFSLFIFTPSSLGAKLRIAENVYATGNIGYRGSTEDLEFQAGAVYFFPTKFLIFKIYAGGGYQLSRNEGFQYPYVSVGTNFLFLFSEIIYPMRSHLDPKYRLGFSIKF